MVDTYAKLPCDKALGEAVKGMSAMKEQDLV
jgi:hypothetical protein